MRPAAAFVLLLLMAGRLVASQNQNGDDNVAAAAERPWTVEDSIAVTYVERGVHGWSTGDDDSPVHWAPDGRSFFFITRRGDLARDANIFKLAVFDAKRLAATAEPLHVLTLSSRFNDSNLAGLGFARWIDNRAIAFLGAKDDAAPQVYRLDVNTGESRVLTGAALGVRSFDMAGGSLVYEALTEKILKKKLDTYPAVFVDQFDLGSDLALRYEYIARQFASYHGDEPRDLGRVRPGNTAYKISPDGRYAVGVQAVLPEETPVWWKAYTGRFLPMWYVLLDLKTGERIPMVNAPLAWGVNPQKSEPLWSLDSTRVVVANTLLPLDEKHPEGSNAASIVRYHIGKRSWEILSSMPRDEATQNARPPKPSRPSISLIESANEPPRLVAEQRGLRLRLTKSDPALAGVRRARIEPIGWTGSAGQQWKGGLMLPAVKPDSTALPLVIQSYVYDPGLFAPDGPFSTAFAAQALAANGFAILQTNLPDVADDSLAGEQFVEMIDSAVDHLARKKLVDSARVGIVGFSYSGWLVSYLISHPGKTKLGAAIDADGGDTSYSNSLLFHMMSPATAATRDFEKRNGGKFWTNKQSWLDRAPGFNLDRVYTPLMLTVNGRWNAAQFMELYAGLHMLNRPVEFMLIPEGAHQLRRPRERQASMQATVDWMSFWLLGREEGDVLKSEQHSRWRSLRAQQEFSQSSNRAISRKFRY